MQENKKIFGLVGRSLEHSFSKDLFDSMISPEVGEYNLYSINPDNLTKTFLQKFDGINVTIPYKKDVIKFLDKIDRSASHIGSVNCVKNVNGVLTGYNTDYFGISITLKPYIDNCHNVLILGNGGVSNTVQYYIKEHHIAYTVVGRNGVYDISYDNLSDCNKYDLIINTTPVGMYPNVNDKLNIPYNTIQDGTVIFDLIYNPEETAFLKECRKYTKNILNGMQMLKEQAIASYKIWEIYDE